MVEAQRLTEVNSENDTLLNLKDARISNLNSVLTIRNTQLEEANKNILAIQKSNTQLKVKLHIWQIATAATALACILLLL